MKQSLLLFFLITQICNAKMKAPNFTPLNINTVSEKKLLFFFKVMRWPSSKAKLLLQYRQTLEYFESISQLALLAGIGKKFSCGIAPFFTVSKSETKATGLLNTPKNQTNDPNYLPYKYKLQANPINLNTASATLLCSLPNIDWVCAKKIIRLRNKKNGFKHRWEILAISDITPILYQKIRSFIYVAASRVTHFELLSAYKNELSNQPQKDRATYKTILFFESKKIKFNALVSYKNSEINNYDSSIKQPLIAFSASYNSDDALIKQLLLGVFKLHLGQGILFGSAFDTTLTSSLKSGKQNNRRPQQSISIANKNSCYGLSMLLGRAKWEWILFISHKQYAAKIDGNEESEEIITQPITTIMENQSANILPFISNNKEETITELMLGTQLNFFLNKQCRLGACSAYYIYDKQIAPSTARYGAYQFNGKQLVNYSFDLDLNIAPFNLFAEIGWSHFNQTASWKDRTALKLGLLKNGKIFSFLIRGGWGGNYFISPRGAQKLSGRTEFLLGVSTQPHKNIKVTATAELHKSANQKQEDGQHYSISTRFMPVRHTTLKLTLQCSQLTKNDSQIEQHPKCRKLGGHIKLGWLPQREFNCSLKIGYNSTKSSKTTDGYFLNSQMGWKPTPHTYLKMQFISYYSQSTELPLYIYSIQMQPFTQICEIFYHSGTKLILLLEEQITPSLNIGLFFSTQISKSSTYPQNNSKAKECIACYMRVRL